MEQNNNLNGPDLSTEIPQQPVYQNPQQPPVNNNMGYPQQQQQQYPNGQQFGQNPQQQYYQPQVNYQNVQQPYYGVQDQTQKADAKATLALVMGLIGIVAWFLPIAGYPITIIGIVSANMGMKSPTGKGKAIAGMILSIVFLICTLLNSIAGVLMNL